MDVLIFDPYDRPAVWRGMGFIPSHPTPAAVPEPAADPDAAPLDTRVIGFTIDHEYDEPDEESRAPVRLDPRR